MEYQLPGWVLTPDTLSLECCAHIQECENTGKQIWVHGEAHPRVSGSGVVVLKVSLMVLQLVHPLTWILVGKQMLPSTPTSHRHNYQWVCTQNCRVTCPSQGETPEMTKRKVNSLGCCFS